MTETDRVAVVGWIWFIGWTIVGHAIGRWWGDPVMATILGFLFALVTLPAWPWILPQRVDDWMHDLPVDSKRQYRHLWLPSWHAPYATSEGRHGKRVALVAAAWFLFWMIAGAALGGYTAKPGAASEAIYAGFFNGAWWALLTSFVWPWFMPTAIDRWMYRSDLG
jgi:hypothetical protein